MHSYSHLVSLCPKPTVPTNPRLLLITAYRTSWWARTRHVHNVLLDGNCMFWTISHQFYGSDEHSSQKHAAQGMATPICTVVTAKTRHLDPLLFLVFFINDLNSSMSLFADDAKCSLQISRQSDCLLQYDLDVLAVWSKHWNLFFNESKCSLWSPCVLIFTCLFNQQLWDTKW